MKLSALARGWRAKAVTLAVAATALIGMGTFAPPAHAAGDRGALRPGCSWDAYQYYTQYCQVYSPSMGRDIPVQIVASTNGGNKALYLLDGLRGPETHSDWTWKGNAPRVFEGSNVNLVMPGAGTASFYTNWNKPSRNFAGPFNYQWETFLTQELPVYLEQEFGISRTGNSIAGLSMGASAALSLAYNHRDQFAQAMSFSGYLHTTAPGMSAAIQAAQLDAGGYNSFDMWGLPLSPERVRNDPFLNINKMKGLDLYISAASGVPPFDKGPAILYLAPDRVGGIPLEQFSNVSTREFELAARAQGLNATFQYSPFGVHDWGNWESELSAVRGRVESIAG